MCSEHFEKQIMLKIQNYDANGIHIFYLRICECLKKYFIRHFIIFINLFVNKLTLNHE